MEDGSDHELISSNGFEGAPTIWMSLAAMALAFVLSLLITKVYQITFTGERYSQAFVHTIIMMSVVSGNTNLKVSLSYLEMRD